jgi:lipooligosaccharide transport system ATP-binding protein
MHAGRVIARGTPAALVAEHVGRRVLEVYGPPGRLLEVEQVARDAGLPTRRTGPAVAVLRAEGAEAVAAQLSDAVARPANLEDVFVLLTGGGSNERAHTAPSAGSSRRSTPSATSSARC